jgi:tetratricopeptide (TPR) repeat protein
MADNKENVSFEEVTGTKATTSFSAEEFITKYLKPIGIVVGVLTLAAIGYFFYNQANTERSEEGQAEMFKAVLLFEKDSLEQALKGGKGFSGLQTVADEYAGTDAGKLAALYTGNILLRQGKFDDAIEYLSRYDLGEDLIQARAWSLIGDANMDKKEFAEAASYYKKAAELHGNDQISPIYLMKLGLAYELQDNWKEAANAYNVIVEEYPKSQEVSDAKKYKAKAEARASSQE